MALTDLEERRLPAQRGNEPFRSRRITSPSFAAGCYARFLLPQHLGGKLVQARVIDLSVRGIGALLPGSESEPRHAPPVGTILPELALQYFGTELFRGTAEVIHNRVQDAGVRLGLCLTSDFVDMHMLHRRVHRLAARERWQSLVVEVSEKTERPFVARPPEGIAPDFAAWVEKQRRFFEAACALLKSLEREARQWDALTCSEIIDDVFTELKGDMARGVATLSEELNQHLAHLPQDLQTTYKKHVAVRVGPYFMDGRFYWRARNRPLGYAGDYEMMNILYGAETDGEGLLARLFDFTAREQAGGRAVINRKAYLASRITECVERTDRIRSRVASIGCGPARELQHLLALHPEVGARLDVVLLDQDPRALEYCERTLMHLARTTGARLHFVGEPVMRLMQAEQPQSCIGERDLIYTAGLFDYLTDAAFVRLAEALYRALASDGLLIIGNMSDRNPTCHLMDAIMDWRLYHRSPEDLLRLASRLEALGARVEVRSEPLGVNLFLYVWRG